MKETGESSRSLIVWTEHIIHLEIVDELRESDGSPSRRIRRDRETRSAVRFTRHAFEAYGLEHIYIRLNREE